jgi:hypothetical protein
MKHRVNRIFFIIVVSLGLTGILLFAIGGGLDGHQSNVYLAKVQQFQNYLSNITKVFSLSGLSDETKKSVNTFIQQIPRDHQTDNNFIFVDENGNVLYALNNNYIQPNTTSMDIAWLSNAMVIVYKDSSKTWFNKDFNGSVNDGSTGIDEINHIGEDYKLSSKLDEVTQLILSHTVDYEGAQTTASIAKMTWNNKTYYMFWLRDNSVDTAVYTAMGRDNTRTWYYLTCVGVLLFLLYWLMAPVWVFLDARRRQSQPLPWALLVLLTNIVGLVVYWIVQSQNIRINPTLACPACGKPVQKSHLFCPWCAAPLKKICKACGKALEDEWVACPWCGKPEE